MQDLDSRKRRRKQKKVEHYLVVSIKKNCLNISGKCVNFFLEKELFRNLLSINKNCLITTHIATKFPPQKITFNSKKIMCEKTTHSRMGPRPYCAASPLWRPPPMIWPWPSSRTLACTCTRWRSRLRSGRSRSCRRCSGTWKEQLIRNTIILTVFKCFKTVPGHLKCIWRAVRDQRVSLKIAQKKTGQRHYNRGPRNHQSNGYYRMELVKKHSVTRGIPLKCTKNSHKSAPGLRICVLRRQRASRDGLDDGAVDAVADHLLTLDGLLVVDGLEKSTKKITNKDDVILLHGLIDAKWM